MESEKLLMSLLNELGWSVSRAIHDEVCKTPIDQLAAISRESEDDTIYEIDRRMEELIVDFFDTRIRPNIPVALLMEGTPAGLVFSGSGRKADAEFTILMDPLDGTRGLMYGKRSAWLLCAAAPGSSPSLSLQDIVLATQTEIPAAKQFLADQLTAFRGKGALGVRRNLYSSELTSFHLTPSRSKKIHSGFFTFNRFFPDCKEVILAVEQELYAKLAERGEAGAYFEDQYICNGGQMAELIMGHDRFVCDLRAVISDALVKRGGEPMLCTHPYDICTELVAREAGAFITDEAGNPLDAPFDTTTNVTWIGYANADLKAMIEPILLEILVRIERYVSI